MNIIFIVGQTAVGKSSTLETLFKSQSSLQLLPNRRELTDQIIIPEMLADTGQEVRPVKDRVERFALTAAYRKKYHTGVIHALKLYLEANDLPQTAVVFDNIRGLEECQGALETFHGARFIFLYAPPLVRLKRMLGRQDAFDSTQLALSDADFKEKLEAIPGALETFGLGPLLELQATSDETALLNAVKIIATEVQNYHAEQAVGYLKTHLDDDQLLYLDTSQLGIDEVSQNIQDWL